MKCEICILAGGRSRRMGRDKTRLRLGSKTMLGHVRAAARATGFPVRIIRRDTLPPRRGPSALAGLRHGPLAGIYTALKTTQGEFVLFLAADMPFISPKLIALLLAQLQPALNPN